MGKDNICYMCCKTATSREHVPPLCLFPESKDTRGLDFRKNLLTVPSCEEHNSKKSKDDEFLLVSIAGIVGNNFLGYFHNRTKVNRALRRKSENFLSKKVMRNATSGEIKLNGKKYPVLYGNPDYERLIKCFEQIAIGLFFDEFSEVFKGECTLLLGFIKYNEDNRNTLVDFIRDRFKLEQLARSEKGENPDVFKYQFCDPDENGLISLRMQFYQGTEVYVSFKPENKPVPFNMGVYFIQKGLPVTVTLGEKEYLFNKEQKHKIS